MTRPAAYILAGGKSSRFGTDKALAEFGGQPLICHIAGLMLRRCDRIAAIADAPGKYANLGLSTQADRLPNRGPLGGLHAALSDQNERCGPGWIVVVSCDLAGLKCEWVETILQHVEGIRQPQSDGFDPSAVAFHGDFWQPFPAAFHSCVFPVVCEQLQSGTASFQRLLSDPRLKTSAVPLPSDWPQVVQANTPAELEQIRTFRTHEPD